LLLGWVPKELLSPCHARWRSIEPVVAVIAHVDVNILRLWMRVDSNTRTRIRLRVRRKGRRAHTTKLKVERCARSMFAMCTTTRGAHDHHRRALEVIRRAKRQLHEAWLERLLVGICNARRDLHERVERSFVERALFVIEANLARRIRVAILDVDHGKVC